MSAPDGYEAGFTAGMQKAAEIVDEWHAACVARLQKDMKTESFYMLPPTIMTDLCREISASIRRRNGAAATKGMVV